MPERVKFEGNAVVASRYLGWARQRLAQLKWDMASFGIKADSRTYRLEEAIVQIESNYGSDAIIIVGLGGRQTLIICHVGNDTGVNGYTKKFYKLSGGKMQEFTPITQNSNKYKLKGQPPYYSFTESANRKYILSDISIMDDGKYYLNFNGNTYDDPDSYSYQFNSSGLVAEDGSGIAISKTRRFILNQSFEEEFFRAFVTTANNEDRSYLLLDDSLTFRTYKIKGNPVFSRYTDDSILYLHSRTKQDGTSSVLINDLYASGIADGFGDSLFIVNKLYKKKLSDNSKTEISINSDANGAALWGAAKYYRDKNGDQKIGRVKTSTVLGASTKCAEPAIIEKYNDVITTEETFNRCADSGNACYFMNGRRVSGSTTDDYGNKLTIGFSTIANDVKLPYAMTDDGKLTYVRVQKDTDFTQVNTGLYIADILIEESGNEAPIILCDASDYSGIVDSYTGKKVMEQNGPIVIRKTIYTILHAHHDKKFNAALYKKTVYKTHSQDLLPYAKQRTCGYQAQSINGQLKRTLVESESTYWIVVNGTKQQLKDTNNSPYKYYAREYTITAESRGVAISESLPLIFNWVDIPYVDIGYDKNGNLLSETNRQITRIFTTATPGSILFSFDVWNAKSKHNLVLNGSSGAYYVSGTKQLWPNYDTSVTSFSPTVDLYDIVDRKWLLFNKKGTFKELTPPQNNGVNYKRVNGVLMMEVL